jgi:hypothetical protein
LTIWKTINKREYHVPRIYVAVRSAWSFYLEAKLTPWKYAGISGVKEGHWSAHTVYKPLWT